MADDQEYHTVRQGECLTSIAKRYGFYDYRTIYDHSSNEDFRRRRPNPNLIFPGDELFIPAKTQKTETVASGRVYKFRLKGNTRSLRIVLEDWDGEVLADTPYELIVEGITLNGTTDRKGVLKHDIPLDARTGWLKINGYTMPIGIAHLNPAEDTQDDGVSGIQGRLKNLGYDPGPIDGKLGPRTKRAIEAFQEDHPPLAVDGICGPQTLAQLKKEYGC